MFTRRVCANPLRTFESDSVLSRKQMVDNWNIM